MTPSIVSVSEAGITIKAGGVEAPARDFQDMASAAGFVAVATAREGIYLMDRSCADRRFGNRFEVMAFADMVDDGVRDLRASNGWRVLATAGDYTIWGRPGIDDLGDVFDATFNVTKGEIPSGDGGYYRLGSILRAKGLSQGDLMPADGVMAMRRAARGPDHDGKPVWHGFRLEGGEWIPVSNDSGDTIAYMDAGSARAGALLSMDVAASLREGPTPRF